MKIEISADPELLRRAIRAETEAALLRAAIDQKHAEYEDLKECAKNNARNLLRDAADLRDFLRHVIDMGKHDPYWDAVRLNAEALLKRDALAGP